MKCDSELTDCQADAVVTYLWPGTKDRKGLCAAHLAGFLPHVQVHLLDLRDLDGRPWAPPDPSAPLS